MLDHEARLERVLSRHRDAMVVEPSPGCPALIRRDQLLAAGEDVPAVEERVRRWYDSRTDEPGLARIRLRAPAQVDVCELASEIRSHRRLAVAPNHLVHGQPMYGQPMWWSGPADRPRPAPPPPAPEMAGSGRGVTIALLDTGLSPHPWYEAAGWYAQQREEVTEVLDADLDYELDTQAGHGTFVGGVLLSHAPSARLRACRVLGSDGVGDELDVVRALTWLESWGEAGIVNLSLGCHTFDDRPSPVVAEAIRRLARSAVIVACAGNAGSDRPFWPAALKQVIAVAALGRDGERAPFSNYGWWVDACAPGERVTSSFVRFDGPRPRVRGIDPDEFRGFATWSGTSFAAPAVAGTIARRAAIARAASVPGPGAVLAIAGEVLRHRPARPGLGVPVIPDRQLDDRGVPG